ncbi:MAG: bifunctional adenosylcobinamide kinase/adenosylcobinamide-phosphate guanylyltransferase [Chloroflexi bacterium]|nr:bifunctional adenosylcobinamide kinase/adenosylcobinamide-phosphate guanylyltransferase [Chloroflexota bacterium]
MAGKSILILGGARSGKSSLAQDMARGLGERVLFVATGAPLDDEMRSRIEAHRQNRPPSWRTLEASLDVGPSIATCLGDSDVVIIDCITLLVSNVLLAGCDGQNEEVDRIDYAEAAARLDKEMHGLLRCIRVSQATYIVVSNEVGMGLVPVHKSGRVYRDLLGKANQMLAKEADDVYLVVAGIPWRLKGGP